MNLKIKSYVDEKGFVHCPICRSKTRVKVRKDTIVKMFPLFCPKCGNEMIINIQENKITIEPDAKTQSQ